MSTEEGSLVLNKYEQYQITYVVKAPQMAGLSEGGTVKSPSQIQSDAKVAELEATTVQTIKLKPIRMQVLDQHLKQDKRIKSLQKRL